jgi:endonuclease YncB( thermonuclease family)
MHRLSTGLFLVLVAIAIAYIAVRQGPIQTATVARPISEFVDAKRIVVIDGDTIWVGHRHGPSETIRILGIDAPEVIRPGEEGDVDQPYGPEAREFARQVFASSAMVEIRRSLEPDRFGRTLAYVFVDDRNFSALAVENRMAEETVSRHGNDGFPLESAEVLAASVRAGPPPFESPANFRRDHVSTRETSEEEP